MRCCIESVEQHPSYGQGKEGDVIECRHCHDKIAFRNGAWEWARKKDLIE